MSDTEVNPLDDEPLDDYEPLEFVDESNDDQDEDGNDEA